MTEANEHDVRAGLRAWAREIEPSAGDAPGAMAAADISLEPVRAHRARPVMWAAGAAAAGLIGISLITTSDRGRTDAWTSTGDTVAGTVHPPGSTPEPVGSTPPATPRPVGALVAVAVPVVFHPPEPGWSVVGVLVGRGGLTMIGVRHTDGRKVGLQLNKAGSRPSTAIAPVWELGSSVRGHPAEVANGGTMLAWDEAEHGWFLQTLPMSTPFASAAAMAAFADAFEVVDHATFEAWLPPEMRAALHDNPDAGAVNWDEGRGIQVMP
jgi:hypothetical protein